MFKSCINVRDIPMTNFSKPSSFEVQLLMIGNQRDNKLAVANIYRPPQGSRSVFIDELSDFLSYCVTTIGSRMILCRDVNFAGNDGVDEELLTLLEEFGLSEIVSEPTRGDNILDIVAVCEEDVAPVVGCGVVSDLGPPFDHKLVSLELTISHEQQTQVKQTFRDFKSIDKSRFRQLLSSSSLFASPADSAEDYAAQIEAVGSDIINQLAPIKTQTRTKNKKRKVWLSDAKRH